MQPESAYSQQVFTAKRYFDSDKRAKKETSTLCIRHCPKELLDVDNGKKKIHENQN